MSRAHLTTGPMRMLSSSARPSCEAARWILDRHGFEYREECHAPIFDRLAVWWMVGGGGGDASAPPVISTPELPLLGLRDILQYFDARSPERARLLPDDPGERALVAGHLDTFLGELAPAVTLLIADALVSSRRGAAVMAARAPAYERLLVSLAYPLIAARWKRTLRLTPAAVSEAARSIDRIFGGVGEALQDGRRHLVGERFTAADLVFAAMAAPIVLPEELVPAHLGVEPLAPSVRERAERLRESAAASYARRLYRESRVATLDGRALREMARTAEPTRGERLRAWAGGPLSDARVQRFVFKLLRRFRPVLALRGNAIVTRYADVMEVLGRDRDFTIAEINAANMQRVSGPFILGMDRSEDYDREARILHDAVAPEDAESIRAIVVREAAALVEAARPHRRLDVVTMLARVVSVRLLGGYFGVPGPNEQLMARWMRALFWDLFFNAARDAKVEAAANACGSDLRAYLDDLIRRRRTEIAEDRGEPRDFLSRLIRAKTAGRAALDDTGVRRNISGLIVGAVDTTVAAVGKAVDQILRRPAALEVARRAAGVNDVASITRCAFEALRFDPQTPALLRFCPRDTTVGKGRAVRIPAGSRVVVATLSAMFDPEAFEHPDEFRAERSPEGALHFGGGMHACFGRYVNMVQIPELVKAVMALKNVRRASGSAGQMTYEGPFPDHLVVEFDA